MSQIGSIVSVGSSRHPAGRDSNAPEPDSLRFRPPTGTMCQFRNSRPFRVNDLGCSINRKVASRRAEVLGLAPFCLSAIVFRDRCANSETHGALQRLGEKTELYQKALLRAPNAIAILRSSLLSRALTYEG
jgi:hypothetical protein